MMVRLIQTTPNSSRNTQDAHTHGKCTKYQAHARTYIHTHATHAPAHTHTQSQARTQSLCIQHMPQVHMIVLNNLNCCHLYTMQLVFHA